MGVTELSSSVQFLCTELAKMGIKMGEMRKPVGESIVQQEEWN